MLGDSANIVMLLQIGQILHFVLPQVLSDTGVFDDVQHSLRFGLEILEGGYKRVPLCDKVCVGLEEGEARAMQMQTCGYVVIGMQLLKEIQGIVYHIRSLG